MAGANTLPIGLSPCPPWQHLINVQRHPQAPMMISTIEIYGLFGEYDYRLQLQGGLNFIHSPNGYGKSTIMHLVHAILRGDMDYVKSTPFERMDVRFDDDSAVIVEKADGEILVQMQKNELETPIGADELTSVCKCIYIGPERTVIRKGDGHLVPAIEAYAKELSETIRYAKEHTELQKADTDAYSEMSDAELENLSKDIKARLDFIADAGFIPQIPAGYRFPPSRYELSEYRDDYIGLIASLAEYSERNRLLAESIVVFKDIINDVLINKDMAITDTGRIIVSLNNGEAIQLSSLSSGEKQIIIMFYNLLFHCAPKSVAILDEPEISLHVTWQQKLSGFFADICRIRDIQMIVATHSPQVIHDKWDLAVELRPRDARIHHGGRHRQRDLHGQIGPQGAGPGGGGVLGPEDVLQVRGQ